MTKAHQRIIRELRAAEPSGDLFGRWWENIDRSIDNAVIKPVDYATARKVILEYEWLGSMPAVVWFSFGIFFDGHCGGVTVYGPEYAENLGVWDRYGFTGKIICLVRGACIHWAPPHAGSMLIRRSMDFLPNKFKVVTCTVDAEAGEIGTLYQACGFDYVGKMSVGGKRASLVGAGGHLSGRQLGRQYGTRGVESLKKLGVPAYAVGRKARYFAFRGTRKEVKIHRMAISGLIKPYPKRASEGSSASRPKSIGEGRVQFSHDAPAFPGEAHALGYPPRHHR